MSSKTPLKEGIIPDWLADVLAKTEDLVIEGAHKIVASGEHDWHIFVIEADGALAIVNAQDVANQHRDKKAFLKAILEELHAVGYVIVMEAWQATATALAATGAATPSQAAPDDRMDVLVVATVEKHKLPKIQVARINDQREIGELEDRSQGALYFLVTDWG